MGPELIACHLIGVLLGIIFPLWAPSPALQYTPVAYWHIHTYCTIALPKSRWRHSDTVTDQDPGSD
jgi:hypothetical protein